LGAAFFKKKHLSNPSATPKNLVITAAANLDKALETTIPVDIHTILHASTHRPLRTFLQGGSEEEQY
jgi:hypothetical protein